MEEEVKVEEVRVEEPSYRAEIYALCPATGPVWLTLLRDHLAMHNVKPEQAKEAFEKAVANNRYEGPGILFEG